MAGSGLDDDALRTINSGRATLGTMLSTIQGELKKVFLVFVVGMFAGIILMRAVVWPTLERDLLPAGATIIAQTPFDVILLQVKIGLFFGLLLAVPVMLYLAREPLRERGVLRRVPISKWKAALVVLAAACLFLAGSFYAYYLFFPLMFDFLAANATSAGLSPQYSIVAWTQFILVLGLSFGLAAQLPLAMSALTYSGLVPYEVFRDNWKYAVLGIVSFGALFSPPDPFTQLLWATPLVCLYGLSVYLSKVVVTAKRGREQLDFTATVAGNWNRVLGIAVVFAGLYYAAVRAEIPVYLNEEVFPAVGTGFRFPTVQALFGLPREQALLLAAGVVALFGLLVALLYYLYAAVEAGSEALAREARGPGAIDLSALDAEGVRAAPPEAFADLDEETALEHARSAMEDDDPEKAQAVLDRFDETEALRAEENEAAGGEAPPEAADAPASEAGGNVVSSTTAGMMDAFTEDETTEDDIGGYYHDIRFILDSLRSRLFHIVGVFMVVLAVTFYWLYSYGLGYIRDDFLSRVPESVRPGVSQPLATTLDLGGVTLEGNPVTAVAVGAIPASSPGGAADAAVGWPITLHPVEALVFEVKVSTILAAVAVLPLVAYYLWPALEERGFVTGDRRTLLVWGGSMFLGLAAGSWAGYTFVAPEAISWLVLDAYRADMIIAYRVSAFFWLVFLTTVGIGLLVDIPVTMVLFHEGGIVSYHTMRRRWRVPVLGAFAFAAVATPDSLYTMLLIGIPVGIMYFVGLGLLWVITLGGRRGGPSAVSGRTTAD